MKRRRITKLSVSNAANIGAARPQKRTQPNRSGQLVRTPALLDFLNREPDPAGLAFWSNQITECQQLGVTCDADVRRTNVSAAFFLSIEFQETGYLVYRFYKSAYRNLPGDPVPIRFSEFLPDTQQIGKNVVIGQPGAEQQLESNKVAFALDFVTRTRFRQRIQQPSRQTSLSMRSLQTELSHLQRPIATPPSMNSAAPGIRRTLPRALGRCGEWQTTQP